MSPLLREIIVHIRGLHLSGFSTEISGGRKQASAALYTGRTNLLSFEFQHTDEGILLKTAGRTFTLSGDEAVIIADTYLSEDSHKAFNERKKTSPAKKKTAKKNSKRKNTAISLPRQIPLIDSIHNRRLQRRSQRL